jgi:hypothetical protein
MTQLLLTSLRRRCLAVAPVALLVLAAPSAAQDDGTGTNTGSSSGSNGGISVQIVSIGGENQSTVGAIWLGLAACQDNAEIEFRLDNVPVRETFDIYVGQACNTTDSRDGVGDDCDLVKVEAVDDRTQDLRIRLGARDIIQAALGVTDCGATSSKPNLWFLAVDNTGSQENVATANYGRIILNVDTDPPDAPTRVRGGRGENQIPVSWSTGNERVLGFDVFVDSGEGTGEPVSDASAPVDPDSGIATDGGAASGSGATNSECGSGALREGASADSVSSYYARSEGSPTATNTELSRGDIDGTVAAVAVVSIDEAGNKSTLSEVTCVYVVPTTGLKDLYEMNNGEYPQGCPCAATGPAQLDAAWPIGLALAALAYRRRRRS